MTFPSQFSGTWENAILMNANIIEMAAIFFKLIGSYTKGFINIYEEDKYMFLLTAVRPLWFGWDIFAERRFAVFKRSDLVLKINLFIFFVI